MALRTVMALAVLAGGSLGAPTNVAHAPGVGVPCYAFAPPLPRGELSWLVRATCIPPRVLRAGAMRRRRSEPWSAATTGPALPLRISASSTQDGGALMEKAARKVQVWLEDVYEAVDYEAALIRAGVLDPEDLVTEESEGAAEGETHDAGAVVGAEDAAARGELDENIKRLSDSEYLPMELDMTIDNLSDEASSGEICEGKEGELTYGEMDLAFFLSILKYLGPPNGRKFVDVGCGRGQLVLAAGVLGGWSSCEGIEIMPDLLEIGRGALDVVRGPLCPEVPRVGKGGADGFLNCRLHLGDMYEDTEPLRDADVVLAYATCFATDDGETLTKLSKVFASSCKSGSTVVTVNKRLKEEDGFTMITTLQGHNPDSASFDATAFIWRAP
jgi:hypothetical protein